MQALVEQITALVAKGYFFAGYETYRFIVALALILPEQELTLEMNVVQQLLPWFERYREECLQCQDYAGAHALAEDYLVLSRAVGLTEVSGEIAEWLGKIVISFSASKIVRTTPSVTLFEVPPKPSLQTLSLAVMAYDSVTPGDAVTQERREKWINCLCLQFTDNLVRKYLEKIFGCVDSPEGFRHIIHRAIGVFESFLATAVINQDTDARPTVAFIEQLGRLSFRAWLKYRDVKGKYLADLNVLLLAYQRLNAKLLGEEVSRSSYHLPWQTWRTNLANERKNFFSLIQRSDEFSRIFVHQSHFAEKVYRGLLIDAVHDAMSALGEAPCQYALLGMGSLARGDITPYSDIEVLFLIEKLTPITKQYFESVLQLLQFYLITLGESQSHRIGLHLDLPALSDSIFVTTIDELITKHYGENLSEPDFNQGIRYSPLTLKWLMGNDEQALWQQYQVRLTKHLATSLDLDFPIPKLYRQQLAAAGLRYDIGQYRKLRLTPIPLVLAEWEIDLKERFLKPIVSVLLHLKVYFDLPASHPIEIVQALAAEQRLPEHLIEKILTSLTLLQQLRCCLQAKHQSQTDKITYAALQDILQSWSEKTALLDLLSDGDIFALSREVIAPLHAAVNAWVTIETATPDPAGVWAVSRADVSVYGLPQDNQPTSLTRYTLTQAIFEKNLQQLLIPGSMVIHPGELLFGGHASAFQAGDVVLEWVTVEVDQTIKFYRGKLRAEIAEILVLSKTKTLNNHKRYPAANHPVHRLTLGEVDIHAKCYPELPGLEIAVYELSQRLVGGGIPAMTIGKLSWIDQQNQLQIEPLLLSETVPGLDGAKVSEHYPAWYESVEMTGHWQQVLLTLFTQPEDAKPDNFILQRVLTPSGQLRTVFWAIDQDHAFQEPLVIVGKPPHQKTALQTKSILYCLSAMHLPLPTIAQSWLTLLPYESLSAWLKTCDAYDKGIRALFGNIDPYLGRVHTQKETKRTVIPILLEAETIEQLYMMLCRLTHHIGLAFPIGVTAENQSMSLLKLLHAMHPLIAMRYDAAFVKMQTAIQRFDGLTQHAYSVIVDGHHYSLRGNPQVRQSGLRVMPAKEDVLKRGRYSPEKCLGFLNEYLARCQQQVNAARRALLVKDPHLFWDLKYWYFQEQVISNIQFVLPSKSLPKQEYAKLLRQQQMIQLYLIDILLKVTTRWTQLQLVGWHSLRDKALQRLLVKHPDLRILDIRGCTGLTNAALDFIQYYCGKTLVTLHASGTAFKILKPYSNSVSRSLSWLENVGKQTWSVVAESEGSTYFSASYTLERIETLNLGNCSALTSIELPNAEMLHHVMLENCSSLVSLKIQSPAMNLQLTGCTQLTPILLHRWLQNTPGVTQLQLSELKTWHDWDKELLEDYPTLLDILPHVANQWCQTYHRTEEKLLNEKRLLLPSLRVKSMLPMQEKYWLRNSLQADLKQFSMLQKEFLPLTLPILLDRLNAQDTSVRIVAAEVLGELGCEESAILARLLEAVKDQDEAVAIAATRASVKLRQHDPASTQTISARMQERVVNLELLQALKDPSSLKGRLPIRALASLGYDLQRLTQGLLFLATSQDSDIRATATAALGKISATQEIVVSAILTRTKDSVVNVRVAAVRALGDLGLKQPEVKQVLVIALRDSHWRVRCSAMDSLSVLHADDEVSLKALLVNLKDKYFEVRAKAAKVLGKLAGTTMINRLSVALLAQIEDDHPTVRVAVIQALGQLKKQDVAILQVLLLAITEENLKVRLAAIVALGHCKGEAKRIIPVLLSQLNDPDPFIRVRAAYALCKLGSQEKRVIEVFLTSLTVNEPSVQIWGMRGLEKLLSPAILLRQEAKQLNKFCLPVLSSIIKTPLEKQGIFLSGMRCDPCETLTKEALNQMFTWFNRNTLACSRQVSQSWAFRLKEYDLALIEAFSLNHVSKMAYLNQAMRFFPECLELPGFNSRVKVLNVTFDLKRASFQVRYQSSKKQSTINLPPREIILFLEKLIKAEYLAPDFLRTENHGETVKGVSKYQG